MNTYICVDFAQTQENQRSRCGRDDYGKCVIWSIPFHRLSILEDVDRNMHMDLIRNRSEYLRKLVDKDTEEKNQQLMEYAQTDWNAIVGGK